MFAYKNDNHIKTENNLVKIYYLESENHSGKNNWNQRWIYRIYKPLVYNFSRKSKEDKSLGKWAEHLNKHLENESNSQKTYIKVISFISHQRMQMQIKTTIKYHYKLPRMPEMKSPEDTELAKTWSSRNYQTLLTEVYTSKTTLENWKFLFNLNTGKPKNWPIPGTYPKKYKHMITIGQTKQCSKQHYP